MHITLCVKAKNDVFDVSKASFDVLGVLKGVLFSILVSLASFYVLYLHMKESLLLCFV